MLTSEARALKARQSVQRRRDGAMEDRSRQSLQGHQRNKPQHTAAPNGHPSPPEPLPLHHDDRPGRAEDVAASLCALHCDAASPGPRRYVSAPAARPTVVGRRAQRGRSGLLVGPVAVMAGRKQAFALRLSAARTVPGAWERHRGARSCVKPYGPVEVLATWHQERARQQQGVCLPDGGPTRPPDGPGSLRGWITAGLRVVRAEQSHAF
jgi:hypothetical protein